MQLDTRREDGKPARGVLAQTVCTPLQLGHPSGSRRASTAFARDRREASGGLSVASAAPRVPYRVPRTAPKAPHIFLASTLLVETNRHSCAFFSLLPFRTSLINHLLPTRVYGPHSTAHTNKIHPSAFTRLRELRPRTPPRWCRSTPSRGPPPLATASPPTSATPSPPSPPTRPSASSSSSAATSSSGPT